MPVASTSKKLLAALLLVVALQPLSAQAASMRETATAKAEEGRHALALADYRSAAEEGDRAAQRIAGLMLYYGERLYGEEVRQDIAAARRYLAMAASQGCEVSKFMLGKLAAK